MTYLSSGETNPGRATFTRASGGISLGREQAEPVVILLTSTLRRLWKLATTQHISSSQKSLHTSFHHAHMACLFYEQALYV